MNCCILGGSGFIGHHLVNLLSNQGKNLIVIGRNTKPTRILPAGVKYISGDYGDKILMKEVLKEVDEIVDLSYSSVPKTSYDDPVKDI
jgi:UDP-glucose 4-epimerase